MRVTRAVPGYDRYIHLRRVFQPRWLRGRRWRLDRLLGKAGPGAARPPSRPLRAGAANGLRREHLSGLRADALGEHRGVRRARRVGHADVELAGDGDLDDSGGTPGVAELDPRER